MHGISTVASRRERDRCGWMVVAIISSPIAISPTHQTQNIKKEYKRSQEMTPCPSGHVVCVCMAKKVRSFAVVDSVFVCACLPVAWQSMHVTICCSNITLSSALSTPDMWQPRKGGPCTHREREGGGGRARYGQTSSDSEGTGEGEGKRKIFSLPLLLLLNARWVALVALLLLQLIIINNTPCVEQCSEDTHSPSTLAPIIHMHSLIKASASRQTLSEIILGVRVSGWRSSFVRVQDRLLEFTLHPSVRKYPFCAMTPSYLLQGIGCADPPASC